jgi:hypothetical protein
MQTKYTLRLNVVATFPTSEQRKKSNLPVTGALNFNSTQEQTIQQLLNKFPGVNSSIHVLSTARHFSLLRTR